MTTTFIQTVTGEDHGDAFLSGGLQDMASYPPRGLGLKDRFLLVDRAPGQHPEEVAARLLRDETSPIFGARAPAGCIPVDRGVYLFFGWTMPA
ncbi:hypothetical protein [Sphingosinicella sp. BN140058]|uniref:hypothetical protein n=1 Tax=Sphingosinicella sp. BN140058 TaxID=1892855 RepID=UPI00101184DA|nr:hypothetical protein [Sphingosinicella sp. BN140058]QAY80346.1 hypothetical protein ETR14_27270 [Sphingosinicella sp. BN140058]